MLIAKIQKSDTHQLWVRIGDSEGRAYLDLRVFTECYRTGAWLPSKEGVRLPLAKVSELLDAIIKTADRELSRRRKRQS